MEDSAEYLRKNLKYYRTNKKLSQEKLAEKIDLSIHFVRDLELGRKNPSLLTIDKLANALGIKSFQLLMKPDENQNIIIKNFADQLKDKLDYDIDELVRKF